jgi:exosortase/archaeosortase family protein
MGKGVNRRPRRKAARLSEGRKHLIDLSLRAAAWLVIVFVLVPWLFERYAPEGPMLKMNSNVAGLFVVALLAVFALWRKDALLKKPLLWKLWHLVMFGAISLFLYWLSFTVTYSYSAFVPLFVKALYIVIPPFTFAVASLCLALALFGPDIFRREGRALIIGMLVGVPCVAVSLLLRQLWPFLSGTVTYANVLVLKLFGSAMAVYDSAPSLSLDGFTVIIGEACSGVDSVVMFTGVYLFISLLDWKVLDKKRLLWLFPLGLLGAFCMNIVRVASLMMIGAFYSPDFALSLFHENAGWIMFVFYTLGFWYFAYPFVRWKKRSKRSKRK